MREPLPAALTAWVIAQQAAGCSPSTIRLRHDVVALFHEHTDTDPRDAGPDVIASWLARPGRDGRGLAPATRATYFRSLRAFYRWCVLTDRLPRDPLDRLPTPRVPRNEPRPVTTAELGRLIDTADPARYGHLRSWLILGAYQGLRVSEISRVRGEDLRGDVLDVLGKGGLRSTLPLHPAVSELAEEYPRAGWWFPSMLTGAVVPHVRPSTVTRAVSAHFRRHGLDGATHRLRHWTGTTTLQTTGNLEVTRRVMRHASVATTQLYARVADDAVRAAVAALPSVRLPCDSAAARIRSTA